MLLIEKERPPSRARRRFTKEFKDDAVALVLDGDRPIARVAHDLGIGATSLGNWVRQARIDRGEEPGLTTEERSELVRLRRENSKLRMKRELPCERRPCGFRSRATGPLLVGPCPEGRGVPDHSRVPGSRHEPPGVLRLAARQKAGPSPAELAEAELVAEIRRVHADSGRAYGSPRVTAELRRRGRRVNRKRVCRLMRHHGICGIHKGRRPRWKGSRGVEQAPADLVRRGFRPGLPDRVWAGDITYIPTAQGWLHLAVVLDVGSRRVVGYSTAADMAARLAVDALDTAAASRSGRAAGVIFHSDRGPQYLSGDFASALARHGTRQSAGRLANCLGQQRRRVVLRHPQKRTRLPDPVRDPRPGTPRGLRLDRPLQHTPDPLHPPLPNPHRMGGTPPATTKPSRINTHTGGALPLGAGLTHRITGFVPLLGSVGSSPAGGRAPTGRADVT